jgi:putative ABC transport system substrate-binding protein
LRAGLDKLGWTQSTLRLEIRWVTDPANFDRYASELVALGAEVLVAESTAALQACRRQAKAIPIVFLGVADPVGQGFVASLARPGGNITGFTAFDAPMAGKWLQVLAQITPPVARVAVLFHPKTAPYSGSILQACEDAARSSALTVRAAPVNNESEIEPVIAGIAQEARSGLIVLPSAFTVAHHDVIISVANKHRVPAAYGVTLFARSGGLMSYGVDIVDLFRRAADYVDRMLKGAKPADLPVQQPTKFELAINLKTAKALGLNIPPLLLTAADEVIE